MARLAGLKVRRSRGLRAYRFKVIPKGLRMQRLTNLKIQRFETVKAQRRRVLKGIAKPPSEALRSCQWRVGLEMYRPICLKKHYRHIGVTGGSI